MSKDIKEKSPSNISKDNPMTEFQKSLIYKDIGDFTNMTQLALSKKIPKWKSLWDEIKKNAMHDYGESYKMQYLRNYCRDCDKEKMFWTDRHQVEGETSYRKWIRPRQQFWDYFVKNYISLLDHADEFYESRKALFDNERKEKLNDYLKEEVECECGGKYSHRNKAKHFLTQKHLKFFNK